MKTSRILFISFFGLIGVVLLSLLIPAPEKSKTEMESAKDRFREIVKEIPVFKHLKVEPRCFVEVFASDSLPNRITISEPVDSVPHEVAFYLLGDTLVVTSTDKHEGNYAKLYCGDLLSYTALGRIKISNRQHSILVCAQKGGNVEVGTRFSGTRLFVGATEKGKVYSRCDKITYVKAQLNNAELKVYKANLDSVQVVAQNGSNIRLQSPAWLQMQKDGSSKYYEQQ